MQDELYRAAVIACRVVLRPLIKMFLRFGIPHKVFCEIAKRVYVDIASDNSQYRKSISDIAVKTGISRKEVGRVFEEIESLPVFHSNRLALSRIVDNWFNNSQFLDDKGKPRKLAINSSTEIDLQDLIRTAKIDIPFSAITRVLSESGNVEIDKQGYYRPSSKIQIVEGIDDGLIHRTGNAIYAFINTINHNNFLAGADESQKLLERRAFSSTLPRDKFDEFNKMTKARTNSLLEEFDTWLNKNSSNQLGTDPNQGLTGIGVYTFDFPRLPYS